MNDKLGYAEGYKWAPPYPLKKQQIQMKPANYYNSLDFCSSYRLI